MKSEFIYINQQAGNRLPWLDIAKGIAMVAVVFSHEFSSVKPLVLLCNSFMLPLFFMCSGFCLSPGKYGIAEYFSRKVRTLLLPYFVLGLIVSLLHIGINGIDRVLKNITDDLFSWQTLWFLPVLFFADLILYVFLSKAKDILVINVVIGVISLIIGCLFCWQDITMIMNLAVVPIAIFYLSFGYGVKKALNANVFLHRGKVGICLLVLGLVMMMITKENFVLKLNDILPMWKVLVSTMEVVGVMLILSAIITSPIMHKLHCITHLLEYIGKNTMVIFAFHMPVFFYCQTFLRPLFKSQLYYKPIEFTLIWGICLMLIPLFNRYVPNVIGKNIR